MLADVGVAALHQAGDLDDGHRGVQGAVERGAELEALRRPWAGWALLHLCLALGPTPGLLDVPGVLWLQRLQPASLVEPEHDRAHERMGAEGGEDAEHGVASKIGAGNAGRIKAQEARRRAREAAGGPVQPSV